MMGKGNILVTYRSMSPQDQRIFKSWAKANAIFGAALVAILMTVAASASRAPGLPQVAAKQHQPADISAEPRLGSQLAIYEPGR